MKKAKVMDLICIAVMLVVLVVQFLPFWFYSGESTSVQMYVWFPEKCKTLTNLLKDILGKDYLVGDLVLSPVVVLVTSAVGIVLSVIKRDNCLVKLLPVIGGLFGVIGYLSHPAFSLGNFFAIHLILFAIMIAVGAVDFLFALKARKK